MQNNELIINTGGTFNKIYNKKSGLLEIKKNNKIIKTIINNLYKSNKKPNIKGIIYKDSLDITNDDRIKLVNIISKSKENNIIIVHGTDTMNETALFLSKKIKNKTIVLLGSMIPYSINKIEASANLSMALGFIKNTNKDSVYICMNGLIKKHNKIKKNYKRVVFE